jgi:hypothetical protein
VRLPDRDDPALPDVLRGIAADLDTVGAHIDQLCSNLDPPKPGSPLADAHAFAIELEERGGAFLAWVDSAHFPAAVRDHHDEFRAGAERMLAAGRRLAAATERRRVDEFIERATEALQEAAASLTSATQAVMRDLMKALGEA